MAESTLSKIPTPARVAIGLGFGALIGIAYYVIFYSDVAGAIEQTVAARSQLERDLAAAKAAEAAYQKDLEELAKHREREREINKVLPATTEYPAFLSSVQSVANMSGIELTSWNPQPELKEDFYARVPMKVSVRGKFHQIAKFFHGIGQNDRIMNMEDVSIRAGATKDGDAILDVSGLTTAFRSLSPEEIKSAGPKRRGTP